ncbi:glycosyltransferase involved in cell wall biosynthesis [Loktanella ponticola]|uniref:Glycosyltransferase involved in cell wall biosynthesis n=1 Tax=Yoonia ponticola TaxID=1524255 RepID=A0A7W9BNB9_9RHOB|nr:glycosyltransferase [Yoonia ponticola]MBB5723651.1 glycosyltransferase involved in cell wall biosynthesis [Yoonia ponticola]
MSDPRISVIIPHLNQPAMLARCLGSLRDGTRQPDEIIVVDNGSDVLPDVPAHVTLLQQKTPGPGPARNLGVAHATGDVIAFTDADCLARFDWLEMAVRAIAKNDILGGDVRIACVNPRKLSVLEAYESIYAYRMERYIAEEGFTGTGNLVVKRAILESVGPFAGLEKAEDRDWGQRATGLGFEIKFVPQMRVYHPARPSFADLYLKWDRQLAHDYTLINDSVGKLRWVVKTLAMGISPLAEIPQIAASDRVPRVIDKVKAFAGLCRIRVYRAGRMMDLMLRGRPERLAAKWNR